MTTILIKKKDTSGAPAPGDLTNAAGGAEIAINTADKRLYTKNSGGTVVELGTNPATFQVNSAYTFPTSDGTANQVLRTNGSGTLSFATINNGTVTSVDVSGGTTGLTTSGGPITTSGTITIAGTLAVTNGGTGITTVAQGDILYGSASNTIVVLPKNTSATRYLANTGTSNNPAWSQIDLTNGVTGDLPFSNLAQGSALSVLGVTGNATADVASIAAATDNQVLRRSGTSVAFGAVNLASTDAVTGDLPFSNLAQGSALSVLGVTGNATADNGSIAAGTDHQVLRRSGTSLAFGAVNLAQSAAITGTLPVGNGGTGQTSYVNGELLIGNSTGNTLSKGTLTAGSGITITNGAGTITIAATAGGGGTVTSVAFSGGTTGLTVSGSPITTSGTITLSGTLAVANGGTGVTSSTGTGSVVLSTSPTLTTPVLGTPTSGTLSNCTVDGTVPVGYLTIPQNSQSAAYTLVAGDSGKHILHPSADTTARTFTIPANSSVPFAIGTAITFVNQNGAGVVTIAITSDTMRLAGAGTTGSRTLAANGVATAIKITATEWIISGVGLT